MKLVRIILSFILAFAICGISFSVQAQSSNSPLRLEITEGINEPLPIAIANFVTDTNDAATRARQIIQIIVADLTGTGLFRSIPKNVHIGKITNFDSTVQYSDWKAINAEVLVTGSLILFQNGQLELKIRIFDVFGQTDIGKGIRYRGSIGDSRRIAHRIANVIYTRLTGEAGYFDTQIAFVSERGPKTQRNKRLAIMDYDGANVQYLTSGAFITLSPRFSPNGKHLIFTSYQTGRPSVYRMDIATRDTYRIWNADDMTFAPRFSPFGDKILISIALGGNTDIFQIDVQSGQQTRLTNSSAIDTSPSYSPDGEYIVFESDRSGSQQLYVKKLPNGSISRISKGPGRYGTPVWSPRGDYIAFTKQLNGFFHIGVMQTNGTEERILSKSFLDEAPAWAPNGRVLLFFRDQPGEDGGPSLYTVDISGRNLRRLKTPEFASDPTWSPPRSN